MQRNLIAVLLAVVAAAASVKVLAPGGQAGDAKSAGSSASAPEAKPAGAAPAEACRCLQQPLRTALDAVGIDLELETKATLALLASRTEAVRCLVVTVPDPVSSHLSAEFDQALATIQQTAGALGYHLDRFWLPWERRPWESQFCAAKCRGRPGLVLFSREAPRGDGSGGQRELLVTLLAGETPTSGVARHQLTEAIGLAAEMPGCRDQAGRIPVLGPTFSGSIQSLSEVLLAPAAAPAPPGFRVITASASRPGLGRWFKPGAGGLEGADPSPRVSFGSTLNPDDVALAAFGRFVATRLELEPRQVAVIVELNTAYGESMISEGRRQSGWIGWQFPVPTRVSDMRRESLKGRSQKLTIAVGGVELPGALGLRADDIGRPRDALPGFSRSNVNYTEQALLELAETIVRERIRLVGILTTDIQDKIFLAELLRTHAPDVQLFTVGADALLAYPDSQRALFGTLVVSSYPLLLDAQGWGPPFQAVSIRPQFTSEFGMAAYNAILHLLSEETRQRDWTGSGELFIGYQCPFAHLQTPVGGRSPAGWTGRPGVWISAVGKNGLWPISVSCDRDALASGPFDPVVAGPTVPGAPRNITTPWPGRQARLLLIALSAYALWEWSARRRSRAGKGGRAKGRLLAWSEEPYRLGPGWPNQKSQWLLLAQASMLAVVLLCWLTVASVEWIYLVSAVRAAPGASGPDRLETIVNLVTLLAGAVGVGAAITSAIWSACDIAKADRPPRYLGELRMVLGLAALVLAATVVWVLAMVGSLSSRVLLAFQRVENISSGLSPAIPLLAIAGGLYLLLRLEQRRTRLLEVHLLGPRDQDPVLARYAEALPSLPAFDRVLRYALGASSIAGRSLGARLRTWGAPIALSGLLWFVLERTDARSPDGRLFSHLFVIAFCALLLVAATSTLRAARLWMVAKHSFEALARGESSGAFARMKDGMPWGLARRFLLFRPDLHDLGFLVQLHDRWARLAGRDDRAAEVARRYAEEVKAWQLEGGDSVPWRSGSFELLLGELSEVQASLQGATREPSAPAAVAAGDFLAAHVAFAVSWVIAHIRLLLFSGAVASLTLLAAATGYPFEPRRLFASALWVILLGTAATAMRIFFQVERNALVSWFTRTDPGSLSLQSGFVLQMIGVVGLPLLALIAVEFPEVAQFFAGWLDPVARAVR